MLKGKKIRLYVTNDLVYDQRMQRICTTLSDAGADVTLVGRILPRSADLPSWPFKTRRISCFFHRGPMFYAEYNLRIFFDALWHNAAIYTSNDVDTLAGISLATSIKSKPVVFDAHEWFTQVPEVINRPRVQAIWGAIERRFAPKVAGAYTVNSSLSKIFEENLNKPFGIVRNVPFRKEKLSIKKNINPTIIYQGALNVGRGLELAITAMKKLPAYELWLVGEGDLSESLRRLTEESGVEDRVRFWGYRRPEDLHKITSQAHIGINILEGNPKNYYYSLANKFFDFMQAGIPSINMKFPEYESILAPNPCGVMIEDCEENQYIEAIQTLFKAYDSYVDASYVAASLYHWELEREKLLRIYVDVLEN